MKKLLLLIGLIGAFAFTPSVARATLPNTNLPFNLQYAADRGCNTKNQCSKGMVTWSVSTPYLNLWLADAPVSYTTSLGEEISFQVYFKQRDTLPPRTNLFRKWYWKASSLDGSGGGPPPDPPPPAPYVPPTGWNHNWFSYVRFSGKWYAANEHPTGYTNIMQDFNEWSATLHVPGGGEIDFTYNESGFESADSPNNPHITQVSLLPMNGTNQHIYPAITNNPPGPNVPFGGRNVYGQNGFRLVHADGSLDLYGQVTTLYGNAAIADALLTERIDPSGNATKFYYTNFVKDTRTIYLLTHVVDYDGKTNTLTYTTNQLLSRVDVPYGRSAMFTYDHRGNLTNITDAFGLPSSMDYSYDGTNYQWVPFFLKTPYSTYGNTQFTFYDDGLGQSGNAGGTNRINRFLGITHDDGSKELFLYRFDSSQQGIPANIPGGQLPNSPFSTLDAGNSGSSTNLTPFYTRNSYHWNRQQTAARSITNFTLASLATLTSNDYKLAVMTHWLVRNTTDESFLSEVPSMRQEASPDGAATGARVWFDQTSKSQPYRVGDYSGSAACQLLENGSTRWTRTDLETDGLPNGSASSYELPDGTLGSRAVSNQYAAFTASQTCYITNTQISEALWYPQVLSRIIGPESETLISLSAPVSESVTNTIVTNNVAYTYITTRPQRRQLTLTNALNETATAWFNSRQQLTGVRWFNGVTITNLYDANGWLTKTINLSALATNCVSFTNGLLLTHTNAVGLAMQYAWDNLERLVTERFPDDTGFTNVYSDLLSLTAQSDRLGYVTSYEYNGLAEVTEIMDPLGRVTQIGYCACGSPDQITDPANASTAYTHDYSGRLRYQVDTDYFTSTYTRNTIGQATNVTDTAGNNLTVAYNHQGLVKRVSNPTGTLYQVVYDIRDRPIYVTNTYGAVVTNTYDYLNRPLTRTLLNNGVASTETWTYTTNGLATYTDPQQRVTRYGYDSAGRMFAVTNANQEVVSATFNKLGQMLTLTDGRNKTTRWAYDLYGRMIAKTNANGVLVRTNGYDPNGRLTNQWTAAKGKTTYVYDAVGNLTAARYPTFTNTYTYDALNRLLTATSSSGTFTRTYTNLGAFQGALKTEDGPWTDDTLTFYRLTNRKLDTIALVEPGAAVPRTWEFGYDGLNRLKTLESFAGNFTNFYTGVGGRLNRMNLPGGNWITNWFDPAGQLLGRWLNSTNGTLDSYLYTHDLTGLRTNLVRSDGTYANYVYDPIGQLTNAVAREPGGALRRNENFSYTFDAAGNLATRLNATLTQTFSVDNVNQLTSASRSGTLTAAGTANTLAQSVSVNSVGADLYTDKTFATTNGLTLTNGNNQLRFKATDAYSQSVTITQIFNLPATVSYTYDLNGNLVSDGASGYDYDDADRLIRITATNQWKSEFFYDAFGRRIVRKEFVWQSSVWSQVDEVRYVWLGMSVLQERDAANNIKVTYTGRLAREDATSTSFYVTDGNGNVSSLIDSSGNVKARYRYDSFGNLLSKSGPLADANLIRFAAKEYHPSSGLYYYGFRFYAPNLQRWMNEDPIGLAGGLNLYGFVGNDPINSFDPYGLCMDENFKKLNEKLDKLRRGLGEVAQGLDEVGHVVDPVGSTVRDWIGSKLNEARDWLSESANLVGQGTYDTMMGDTPGKYNPYSKGAMDAAEGIVDIDRNNNVLRDTMGMGVQLGADAAERLAELLALKKLGGLAETAGCPVAPRAVKTPVDKSWKPLIEGTAQKTGTPGHQFRAYREAINMAKSGEYSRIRLNRAYSTTDEVQSLSTRRPDILGVRRDGRIDAVEVPSRTDNPAVLFDRNWEVMESLSDLRRGDVIIAPIR